MRTRRTAHSGSESGRPSGLRSSESDWRQQQHAEGAREPEDGDAVGDGARVGRRAVHAREREAHEEDERAAPAQRAEGVLMRAVGVEQRLERPAGGHKGHAEPQRLEELRGRRVAQLEQHRREQHGGAGDGGEKQGAQRRHRVLREEERHHERHRRHDQRGEDDVQAGDPGRRAREVELGLVELLGGALGGGVRAVERAVDAVQAVGEARAPAGVAA